MIDINQLIGQNIRVMRKRRGMSQEDLAIEAGIHSSQIGHIERGGKNPTLRTVEKIAHALAVSIAYLITDATRAPKPSHPDLQRFADPFDALSTGKKLKVIRRLDTLLHIAAELYTEKEEKMIMEHFKDITFRLIEDEMVIPDAPAACVTYGVEVYRLTEHGIQSLRCIRDISTNKSAVERLVHALQDSFVSEEHAGDIICDFVENDYALTTW